MATFVYKKMNAKIMLLKKHAKIKICTKDIVNGT